MRSLLFVNLPCGDQNLPPGFPESGGAAVPERERGWRGGREDFVFKFTFALRN